MLLSKHTFDPANDTFITTLYLDHDEEGNFLDVDSALMHSEEKGYYLARTIIQTWTGDSWETATADEADKVLREHRRSLKTFRPLTHAQVILMIVGQFIPVQEGLRELVSEALRSQGIK